MPNEPFLTVVLPTYNRAQMLKRCVESVLSARSNEFELLVSDNASPDNTQEMLKSISDPRMRFWRNEKDLGAAGNILGLWRQSKGKWIFCLADDDYLLPGALDRVIQILKENPTAGVFLSSIRAVDESGKEISVRHYSDKEGMLQPGMDSMPRLIWGYHLFSRITFQRAWADIEGSERHLESMYPQIYVIMAIMREHPTLYLKDQFVAHTWGNRQFWDYTLDSMLLDRIKIVEDCLQGPRWRKERKAIIKRLIRYMASYEEQSRAWRVGKWREQQATLLKASAIRTSPRYWWRLLKFLLRWNKSGT